MSRLIISYLKEIPCYRLANLLWFVICKKLRSNFNLKMNDKAYFRSLSTIGYMFLVQKSLPLYFSACVYKIRRSLNFFSNIQYDSSSVCYGFIQNECESFQSLNPTWPYRILLYTRDSSKRCLKVPYDRIADFIRPGAPLQDTGKLFPIFLNFTAFSRLSRKSFSGKQLQIWGKVVEYRKNWQNAFLIIVPGPYGVSAIV